MKVNADAWQDRNEPHAASERAWHAALYVLLFFVFVTGGTSQQRGWTDAIAQLMALPILLVASWRLARLAPSRVRLVAMVALAAILVLPWLQLLPLPGPLWRLAPARVSLAHDLAAAGVATVPHTWSLAPAATIRSALGLLPPAALFLGVLGVGDTTQRRLLCLCVALPIASLVLGFLQMGAAQDSPLNPYPQWAPAMGGVFANPNHQGTAMLIGLGICLAFALGRVRGGNPWPAVIAAGILLPGLTLTNSRAAAFIGVLMVAGAPLAMSARATVRSGLRRRTTIVAMGLGILVLCAGYWVATKWMRVDEIHELRGIMRHATMALAASHLPWGSGIGSFVPVFQQSVPDALLMPAYINAAHNDYVQVWLEAGIAGLLVAALAAGALAMALRVLARGGHDDRRLAWSAIFGIAVLLAHSLVDYPLRTGTLMGVAAVLAGILVAQAARDRLSSLPGRTG
jgi:O-antigen ligase